MLFLPVDKVSPVLASRGRPFIPYMLFLPVDKVSPVLASRGRPWWGGGDLLR